MKTTKALIQILFLAFFLSACSAGAASPTSEMSLEEIYTAAAMTVTARAAEQTPPPSPTYTLTPTPDITSTSSPTSVPSSNDNTSFSGGASCDSSIYLSDVTIPDGTVLSPGASFTKTWSVQNTGSCTWTTAYSVAYLSGDAMGGSAAALSAAVSPGGSIQVSVGMTAPSSAGSYTGYWKLKNAEGVFFGEVIYVQIVIPGGTSTVTFTPTSTEEEVSYTSTPTETPASTPTSTPVPADTSEPAATDEAS